MADLYPPQTPPRPVRRADLADRPPTGVLATSIWIGVAIVAIAALVALSAGGDDGISGDVVATSPGTAPAAPSE